MKKFDILSFYGRENEELQKEWEKIFPNIIRKINNPKGCEDCWHNYHCPMPQEGYEFNPDTCKYNPDNK